MIRFTRRELQVSPQGLGYGAVGTMAPAFMTLGIAASVINVQLDSGALGRLGLGFVFMGLLLAPQTRRLLTNGMRVLRQE